LLLQKKKIIINKHYERLTTLCLFLLLLITRNYMKVLLEKQLKRAKTKSTIIWKIETKCCFGMQGIFFSSKV